VWDDVSKLGPKMRESERALQHLEFLQDLVGKSRVEADVAKTRLDYVDQCGVLYTKTIDKRPSDLSIRDSDRVQACRGLNLYPPTITIE